MYAIWIDGSWYKGSWAECTQLFKRLGRGEITRLGGMNPIYRALRVGRKLVWLKS